MLSGKVKANGKASFLMYFEENVLACATLCHFPAKLASSSIFLDASSSLQVLSCLTAMILGCHSLDLKSTIKVTLLAVPSRLAVTWVTLCMAAAHSSA